jgi:tetratricopeptide (TPR) repeat protein/predicted Ser/Thr protein kinase
MMWLVGTPRSELSAAGASDAFPTRPDDDLEHARILAAVNTRLFGAAPLQIAHYRIERLLGAGGMGEVFLARDQALERPVALKLLRTEIDRADAGARLRVEALALARLSHPNVVQVHELGEHDGRAHVVMEYVAGPTLSAWLAREQPSWRAILEAFRSAGQGLAAAHAVGVIHRDFKPDNVIVGDDGRVRVVDFGLAHADAPSSADRAGTPRYMAPEQLAGQTIDARADQYAFCVALHEALWDTLPSRDAARPRGAGPSWVWRCVRRGLAVDPEQRWRDMPSLLAALDERPRRIRAVAVALACVGGLGLGWLTLEHGDPCVDSGAELETVWNDDRSAQLLARFSEADPRYGAAAAEQLRRGLDSWASEWRGARVRSCEAREQGLSELITARREACLVDQLARVSEQLRVILDADRRTIAHAWALAGMLPHANACEDDALLQAGIALPDASAQATIDEIREQLNTAAAERFAGHAERNAERLASAREQAETLGYPPLLAEVLAEQAATELTLGSPKHGVELLELAIRQAYIGRDDRLAAQLWTELTQHAVSEFDHPEHAERWLEQARDAWTRIGLDESALASLAFASGAVALQRGQLDDAAAALEQALRGPDQYLRPFVLERQALLAEQRGEVERELQLREQARSEAAQWFGPVHPRTVRMSVALGLALADAERFERARFEIEQALATWRHGDGRPQRDLAEALTTLCSLEFAEGNLDAALAAAEQAEALLEAVAPEALAERGIASNNVATIAHARGDHEAAAQAYDRAIALLERELGPDHPDLVEVRTNSAGNLVDLGRLDAARVRFETTRAYGPELGLPWTIASFGLAELELRAGAPVRARAWLDDVVLDEQARSTDHFVHALLVALVNVRLGRATEIAEVADLARTLAEAGETGETLLSTLLNDLDVTPAERAQLGLPPAESQ